MSGNPDTPPALVAGSISLGQWNISVDGNGNLTFTNPAGAAISMGPKGAVQVNGNGVVLAGKPVCISNDLGTLDGTNRFQFPGSGFRAAAYWSSNPPAQDTDTLMYISLQY